MINLNIHCAFLGVEVLKWVDHVLLINLGDDSDEEIERDNESEVLLYHPNDPDKIDDDSILLVCCFSIIV